MSLGTITEVNVRDVRFPTSKEAHGSDAVVIILLAQYYLSILHPYYSIIICFYFLSCDNKIVVAQTNF